MARMMDDASRAQVLSSLLSGMDAPRPQMGGPSEGPPSISGESIPEEEFNNPKGPAPSNGVGVANGEPMIPVPASLAHAGMAALMSQASGGRAMGADGAGGQSIQVAQNDGVDPEMLRKMQFLSGPTDTSTDGGWQNDRMYHGSRAGAQREGAVAGGMANSNKKVKRPE